MAAEFPEQELHRLRIENSELKAEMRRLNQLMDEHDDVLCAEINRLQQSLVAEQQSSQVLRRAWLHEQRQAKHAQDTSAAAQLAESQQVYQQRIRLLEQELVQARQEGARALQAEADLKLRVCEADRLLGWHDQELQQLRLQVMQLQAAAEPENALA